MSFPSIIYRRLIESDIENFIKCYLDLWMEDNTMIALFKVTRSELTPYIDNQFKNVFYCHQTIRDLTTLVFDTKTNEIIAFFIYLPQTFIDQGSNQPPLGTAKNLLLWKQFVDDCEKDSLRAFEKKYNVKIPSDRCFYGFARGVKREYKNYNLGSIVIMHATINLYDRCPLDRFYIYSINTHPITYRQVKEFFVLFEKGLLGEVAPGLSLTKMILPDINVREWRHEGEKVLENQNVLDHVSVFVLEHLLDKSQYVRPKL